MGIIKITAEGLIIIGKVLKADGVEECIKGWGEDFFVKYAPQKMKHFRTRSRAIRSFMDEVEGVMKDEKYRKPVQETLGRYPSVIGQIATQGTGIETAPGTVSLRLVPRYLINDEALKEIAKGLDKVERLGQLKGGAQAREVVVAQLLAGLDEYFRNRKMSVSKPLPARDDVELIVHYDPEFDWNPNAPEAKYKGAYYVYWGGQERLKKDRASVKEQLDAFVKKMKGFTPDEIDKLRMGMKPPRRYDF